MLARRCCVSSLLIRRGHRFCKTSPIMRYRCSLLRYLLLSSSSIRSSFNRCKRFKHSNNNRLSPRVLRRNLSLHSRPSRCQTRTASISGCLVRCCLKCRWVRRTRSRAISCATRALCPSMRRLVRDIWATSDFNHLFHSSRLGEDLMRSIYQSEVGCTFLISWI